MFYVITQTWVPHEKTSVKLSIGFVTGFVTRFRCYKPEESLNAILTFFLCLLGFDLV